MGVPSWLTNVGDEKIGSEASSAFLTLFFVLYLILYFYVVYQMTRTFDWKGDAISSARVRMCTR